MLLCASRLGALYGGGNYNIFRLGKWCYGFIVSLWMWLKTLEIIKKFSICNFEVIGNDILHFGGVFSLLIRLL